MTTFKTIAGIDRRLLLLIILVVALVLRLATFSDVKLGGFDEMAYLNFAKVLHSQGVAGIRDLTNHYSTDKTLAQSPLPLRIGFVALADWVCEFCGKFSVYNIAWISLIASVGVIGFSFLLVREISSTRDGILVSILMLSSPLAITLSRRALQDGLVGFFTLMAIYYFHQCWRRRRKLDYWLLGVALACAFLLKEATLFFYPILLLAGIYYLRTMQKSQMAEMAQIEQQSEEGQNRDWKKIWPVLIPLAVAPLIYLAITVSVAGGVERFFHVYREYAAMQSHLPYTMDFGRGAWFRYFLDFLLLSPVPFLLACVAVAVPLSDPRQRDLRAISLIYLLSGLVLYALLPVQAVRVVFYADLFLRVMALFGVCWLSRELATRFRWNATLIFALLFSLMVISDLWQFYVIFQRGHVYDPTTAALIHANGFWNHWTGK